MNNERDCGKLCGLWVYSVAVLGAFLIVAGLVSLMKHYTQAAPLGTERAVERKKALTELRASNEEVLNNPNYAWQDQAKGVVRMPIGHAIELSLQLWQNPAAARSNLIVRVEKATAVPPPPKYE